jgi:hypothetical protein
MQHNQFKMNLNFHLEGRGVAQRALAFQVGGPEFKLQYGKNL